MSYRIVVSDSKVADLSGSPVLAELGARVETTDAHEPGAVIEAASGADALVIDSKTDVTARVIEALDDLTVIGRAGIGVDNIDVAAAAAAGVEVINVPDYCVDEVSTHALALALACLRRITVFDSSVKAGRWEWTEGRPIPRLAEQTIGLVAFGKIARRVAAKLQGFNVDVIAYDPYVREYRMRDFGVEKVGFEELLGDADIVSVHAPLTDETRGMFDAAAFGTMQDDAIFVNTARGPIVAEKDLEAALAAGEIAQAGLDVLEEEPPQASALLDRDDVILSPHTAWYSEGSREDIRQTLAADIAGILQGEEPINPVDPASGWF